MIETLTNLLLLKRTGDDQLKLGIQPWVFELYQIPSDDDPGLTLTYFTASSNLVLYAKKLKQWILLEIIVVYDIKVGK